MLFEYMKHFVFCAANTVLILILMEYALWEKDAIRCQKTYTES